MTLTASLEDHETDMGMDRYSRHRFHHSEINYGTELPGFQYTFVTEPSNCGAVSKVSNEHRIVYNSTPPRLIHNLASILLPLLQNNSVAPLRLVNGIDVPAGFNAEPRPSTPRRVIPVSLRHVDTGA